MNKVEKMEQALDEIVEKIEKWRTDGDMEHWQYSQLFDIADEALAMPKRNCDVGTAEELLCKHNDYCGNGSGNFSCINGTSKNCKLCFAKFMQMPYKREA